MKIDGKSLIPYLLVITHKTLIQNCFVGQRLVLIYLLMSE